MFIIIVAAGWSKWEWIWFPLIKVWNSNFVNEKMGIERAFPRIWIQNLKVKREMTKNII